MLEPIRKDKFRVSGFAGPAGLRKVAKKSGSGRKDSIIPVVEIIKEDLISGKTPVRFEAEGSRESLIVSSSIVEIQAGDIVHISENGVLRVVLTDNSKTNTLLVTEQCDNLCEFCSQPPNDLPDRHLYFDAALAISEFNTGDFVGISGGEPFLDKESMLFLLEFLSSTSCKTPLHILTNGRAFSDFIFAEKFKNALRGRGIILGIPLYSLDENRHDDMVGSRGAWMETVQGLINLSHLAVPVELRFIPTSRNYFEMSSVLEFAARVFPSVFTISIMNLEPKGWARKNWDKIYISPKDYSDQLACAVKASLRNGIDVKLFNYTHCSIDSSLWSFACQSISDWKNSYLHECEKCDVKNECCGFFSWVSDKYMESPRAIVCQ